MRTLLPLLLLVGCGGPLELEDDGEYAPEPGDEMVSTYQSLALASPIPQRAGAWWGDVTTPSINQVWGEVVNSTPGKNLTAPFTFKWKCSTPKIGDASQTLKLTSGSFSVDSDVKRSFSNPGQGTELSYTLDPAAISAGWHEIRIRCKGEETVGSEAGEVTAITAGFPVQIRGGTANYQNHCGNDCLDTHGWYDRGVNYVYATFLNVSQLVGQPQSGVIALKLRARVSGDTVLDHFMVKIDGVIAKQPDGSPIEFHGDVRDRTVYVNTASLSNGAHVFAMHAHGLETSSSEQPGKQLAAQSEITVTVQN